MPVMSMKDLTAHVASINNAQQAAAALVAGVAEMVGQLSTRTEVANAQADLRNNISALAGSIFWGTPFQAGMVKPAAVEPPWARVSSGPLSDQGAAEKTPVASPSEAPGAHLAVEPAVEDTAGEQDHDEHADANDEDEVETEEADEPENGPVDRPARAKPKPKHKPAHRGRR